MSGPPEIVFLEGGAAGREGCIKALYCYEEWIRSSYLQYNNADDTPYEAQGL